MADWREQIRKDPRLKKLERQLQSRKRLLEQDKIYLVETERLTRALEKAYKQNPKAVRSFFRQFSHPTPFQLPRIQEFIEGQKSKVLQRALERTLGSGIFSRRIPSISCFRASLLFRTCSANR